MPAWYISDMFLNHMDQRFRSQWAASKHYVYGNLEDMTKMIAQYCQDVGYQHRAYVAPATVRQMEATETSKAVAICKLVKMRNRQLTPEMVGLSPEEFDRRRREGKCFGCDKERCSWFVCPERKQEIPVLPKVDTSGQQPDNREPVPRTYQTNSQKQGRFRDRPAGRGRGNGRVQIAEAEQVIQEPELKEGEELFSDGESVFDADPEG